MNDEKWILIPKDTLKYSPELQLLQDNDIDDYAMAVVMINEEFAEMLNVLVTRIRYNIRTRKKCGEIKCIESTKACTWAIL